MSDAKELIRHWLDITAMGPAEAWEGKADDDIIIRLPYAPPGVVPVLNGFDHARDMLSHHWETKTSFDWHDVVILATEDPELFVTTARSEAVLTSGQPYGNDYIMLTRVRGNKVVEHSEYFNPVPIMAMLAR